MISTTPITAIVTTPDAMKEYIDANMPLCQKPDHKGGLLAIQALPLTVGFLKPPARRKSPSRRAPWSRLLQSRSRSHGSYPSKARHGLYQSLPLMPIRRVTRANDERMDAPARPLQNMAARPSVRSASIVRNR